jgi:carbonic anhydrase/acetyltransferase-like protein (isoleucine patch superfamily)
VLGSGKLSAMVGRLRRALRIAVFRRRHPRVQLGPGVMISGRLTVGGPGRVVIGAGCNLESKSAQPNRLNTLTRDAVIEIGPDSYLNGVHIAARESVVIGARATLGAGAIFDTDFHGTAPGERHTSSPTRPVRLGDDVWLAERAAVLKGVTVGDAAVIGYGAVVTRDVEAGAIVAGAGVRVVGNVLHGT